VAQESSRAAQLPIADRTPKLRRGGSALIAAGLVTLAALPLHFHQLLGLIERHVSHDRDITRRGAAFLAASSVIACALIIVSGVILRRLAHLDVNDALHRMFGDERTGRRSYFTLTLSWTSGLLTLLWFTTECGHAEGNLLETIQVAVLLAAACVLIRTAASAGRRTGRGVIHGSLGVIALLAAGEEVSWGQSYLQWRTPEAWATVNVQNETNVHNLFNAWFGPAYTMFVLAVLAFFVASALLLAAGRDDERVRWMLFRPNLSGLLFALIASLLVALPGRCPAWFEIVELSGYLLLFFWAFGNMKREPSHPNATAGRM